MGSEKITKFSRDVLLLSRNTLFVNMRFLDIALNQFELKPMKVSTISTDGHFLFYNPIYVLKSFKNEKEKVTRDYLHIVMHCIYRHMFVPTKFERNIWNLACDITIENIITDLGLKSTTCKCESKQAEYIAQIKKECSILTAEKIYHYLKSLNLSSEKIAEIQTVFISDNHEIWYSDKYENNSTNKNEIVDNSSNNEEGNKNSTDDTDQSNDTDSSDAIGQSNDTNSSDDEKEDIQSSSNELNHKELYDIWKDISERIQTDIETFSKNIGNSAGNLLQNLKEVNREKYDYTTFLKKFSVRNEVMKINDDEFDYIFYTYGLKLYEKMPLIEPLEYKDIKQIKEFVIAIDTSGSVKGEMVQSFIQKTYNIIKSTESFAKRINLHIIQCDAEIQEHIRITNQEEFDEYLKNMELKGFGGTDFRPVFEFVDDLVANKEFFNLKGLIYFTDGYGTFPAKQPAYDTAFVFVKDDYEIPEVPVWAIKLILEKENLKEELQ